jgi:hypothetical protein
VLHCGWDTKYREMVGQARQIPVGPRLLLSTGCGLGEGEGDGGGVRGCMAPRPAPCYAILAYLGSSWNCHRKQASKGF